MNETKRAGFVFIGGTLVVLAVYLLVIFDSGSSSVTETCGPSGNSDGVYPERNVDKTLPTQRHHTDSATKPKTDIIDEVDIESLEPAIDYPADVPAFRAQFVLPDGQPIVGATITLTRFDGIFNKLETFDVLTDSEGKVSVKLGTHERVILKPKHSYYFEEIAKSFGSTESWHRIQLHGAVSFTVALKYENGDPYIGLVQLANDVEWQTWHSWRRWKKEMQRTKGQKDLKGGDTDEELYFHFKKGSNHSGTIEVKNFPALSRSRIIVYGDNRGKHTFQLDASILKDGDALEYTVEREYPKELKQQQLLTVLSEKFSKPVYIARYIDFEDSCYFYGGYDKTEFTGYNKPFRILAIGEETSWISDEITIEDGKALSLDIPYGVPGGTVTVNVVDENGNPIEGATLDINQAKIPLFPAVANAGVIALSDATGFANLKWQPEGLRGYRVEAKGFMPTVIEARVSGGSLTELGRVQLMPARGQILLKQIGDWDSKIIVETIMWPARAHRSGLRNGGGSNRYTKKLWKGLVPTYEYRFQIECYRYGKRGNKIQVGDFNSLSAYPSDDGTPTVIELDIGELRVSYSR